MNLFIKISMLTILLYSSTIYAKQEPQRIGFSVIYHIDDENWNDVNDAVKDAIREKGIVISYTSHAKKLLDRTAPDLGLSQDTYLGAQIHYFCQVGASHRMIKKNPHIIAGCPYGIAVYELKSKPGTIYVSRRQSPTNEPAYNEIGILQDEIIKSALDIE